jgi:hypothetical protein
MPRIILCIALFLSATTSAQTPTPARVTPAPPEPTSPEITAIGNTCRFFKPVIFQMQEKSLYLCHS